MAKTTEPKFTKDQIVNAAKYREQIDLVKALLNDGEEYTLKQVDGMIEEYMKKEVQ